MQQNLNLGTRGDKNTGDDLNLAMDKIEDNFTDLYISKAGLADTQTFTGENTFSNRLLAGSNENIDIGNDINRFRNIFNRRTVQSGATDFWISSPTNNISNKYGWGYESDAYGNFISLYTLDPSGVPISSTDLTDKGYVDSLFTSGSFTPLLVDQGGTGTYTTSTAGAIYNRMFNLVWISINISGINNTAPTTSTFRIGGLPYSISGSSYYNSCRFSGSDISHNVMFVSAVSGTQLSFSYKNSLSTGNYIGVTTAQFSGSGDIDLTLTYRTSDPF